jgi:hypothetical protein
MSNASSNSSKPKRQRGHLLRVLERLGLLSPEQVDDVRVEQEQDPSQNTVNLVLKRGVSQESIEFAEEVDSDDLPEPEDPSTGEILVGQFKAASKQAQSGMNETVTQGVRLSDVAAAIAKKAKASG